MPYSIRKIGKNRYQVYNTATGEIHSKGTTKKKAEGQFRLLQGIARNELINIVEGGMSDWTNAPIGKKGKLPPIPNAPTLRPARQPRPRFYTDLAKDVAKKTPPVKTELDSAIKSLNNERRKIHLDFYKLEDAYKTASETEKVGLKKELDRLGKKDFELENDSKELQKIITETGSLTASGRRRGGSRADISRIERRVIELTQQAETLFADVETLQRRRTALDRLIEEYPAILDAEHTAQYNNLVETIGTMWDTIINIANEVGALNEERLRLTRNLDEEDDLRGILDDFNDGNPPPAIAGRLRGGWNFSNRNYNPATLAYNALLNGLTENYRSDITKEGVRQDIDRNIEQAKKYAKNPNPEAFATNEAMGQFSRYGSGHGWGVRSARVAVDADPNAPTETTAELSQVPPLVTLNELLAGLDHVRNMTSMYNNILNTGNLVPAEVVAVETQLRELRRLEEDIRRQINTVTNVISVPTVNARQFHPDPRQLQVVTAVDPTTVTPTVVATPADETADPVLATATPAPFEDYQPRRFL
jgi:hypothetical protein